MNKNLLRIAIIATIALVLLNVSSPCYAQDATKKLGRGLVNILTGWIELPKNIYKTSVESNPFSGITVGLAKGLGMTVVRTGAGVYETATFPFPLPQEYKPILEPEYVLNKETQ
jgi:putative exosortase-associated protein (TIGR04073 family)